MRSNAEFFRAFLFNMNKIIGIYKITNLINGKVYIGQSIDIEKRFNTYKRLDCKMQTKIYRSLNKYGVENHTFEIIQECDIEILNERERFWQEHYNVLGKNGLNCRLTKSNDKTGKMCEETKIKLSDKKKGVKVHTIESKRKISEHFKGKKKSEETRRKLSEINKGKKLSEETRKKISQIQIGKKLSEEHKRKISESNKGKKKSEEFCRKLGERKKGTKQTIESKLKMSQSHKKAYENGRINAEAKKVINTETGEIYTSITQCMYITGYKNLHAKLRGSRKNNTPFKYL